MPFIATEGAELYFEEHGEGPPLVLVHGVGGNHAVWFQQIPVFAASFRVVTFDQRGFGRSSDPGRRSRSAFVQDLLALCDHLRLERIALVGQSMGGGTCVGFAHAYPERVAALVLCDTTQGFREEGELGRIMAQARAATHAWPQTQRVLAPRTVREQPALACLYAQLASFNATDRQQLSGRFEPLVDPADLAATRIPTLFLVGAEDPLYPPAAVRALRRALPGSGYVEIEGAGHSAYFERPAEFNEAVLAFLRAAHDTPISSPRCTT